MPGQSPAYNQRAEDGTGLGLRLEGEQVAPLGGCRESSPFFGVSFNPPPQAHPRKSLVPLDGLGGRLEQCRPLLG